MRPFILQPTLMLMDLCHSHLELLRLTKREFGAIDKFSRRDG